MAGPRPGTRSTPAIRGTLAGAGVTSDPSRGCSAADNRNGHQAGGGYTWRRGHEEAEAAFTELLARLKAEGKRRRESEPVIRVSGRQRCRPGGECGGPESLAHPCPARPGERKPGEGLCSCCLGCEAACGTDTARIAAVAAAAEEHRAARRAAHARARAERLAAAKLATPAAELPAPAELATPEPGWIPLGTDTGGCNDACASEPARCGCGRKLDGDGRCSCGYKAAKCGCQPRRRRG
jgi:hypothetical protein